MIRCSFPDSSIEYLVIFTSVDRELKRWDRVDAPRCFAMFQNLFSLFMADAITDGDTRWPPLSARLSIKLSMVKDSLLPVDDVYTLLPRFVVEQLDSRNVGTTFVTAGDNSSCLSVALILFLRSTIADTSACGDDSFSVSDAFI